MKVLAVGYWSFSLCVFNAWRNRSEVMIPEMDRVTRHVIEMAEASADMPMLALTHGQPATPTTMGKELGNFAYVNENGSGLWLNPFRLNPFPFSLCGSGSVLR